MDHLIHNIARKPSTYSQADHLIETTSSPHQLTSRGFRPDEHLDEMQKEEAGDGADGDGQKVDGGHHQHSALTYFYSIVFLSLKC